MIQKAEVDREKYKLPEILSFQFSQCSDYLESDLRYCIVGRHLKAPCTMLPFLFTL